MSLPEAIIMQVGKRTRYGARPHPSDPWGYTKELLEKRGEAASLSAVVTVFKDLGIENEVAASKWLVLNKK